MDIYNTFSIFDRKRLLGKCFHKHITNHNFTAIHEISCNFDNYAEIYNKLYELIDESVSLEELDICEDIRIINSLLLLFRHKKNFKYYDYVHIKLGKQFVITLINPALCNDLSLSIDINELRKRIAKIHLNNRALSCIDFFGIIVIMTLFISLLISVNK